jgi:hypothetical protein
MSYAPEGQADSTGESRGAAVSFASKQEAIAYIVSLAPRRTSLLDIREAGSRADAQGIEAVSPLTDAGVAALGPDAFAEDAKSGASSAGSGRRARMSAGIICAISPSDRGLQQRERSAPPSHRRIAPCQQSPSPHFQAHRRVRPLDMAQTARWVS